MIYTKNDTKSNDTIRDESYILSSDIEVFLISKVTKIIRNLVNQEQR